MARTDERAGIELMFRLGLSAFVLTIFLWMFIYEPASQRVSDFDKARYGSPIATLRLIMQEATEDQLEFTAEDIK